MNGMAEPIIRVEHPIKVYEVVGKEMTTHGW